MTQNTKDDIIYDEPKFLTSTSSLQFKTCPVYEVTKTNATQEVPE